MAARVWPVDAVGGSPSNTGRSLRQGAVSTSAGQGSTSRPLGGLSGVRPGTPVNIATATSTTWTVTPFLGLLDGAAAATAGVYAYSFDTNQTGSVTAAAASTRIDRLDVQVVDPAEGGVAGANPLIQIVRTDGVAGSGVPAAAPAQSHPLALINVPTSGSPTVTWNATYYCAPGGFVPFNTLAGLQAWTTAGAYQHATVINDTTTGYNGDYVWSGSVWMPLRGALQHLEFTATDGFADAGLRYPQWTADAANTVDAQAGAVTAWNNAVGNPSGLQFTTVGVYSVNVTAVLAANITSGTTVFQGLTGSTFVGGGTSGSGNQNISFSIPNYRVTAANQRLTILMVKTNGNTSANSFRASIDRIW